MLHMLRFPTPLRWCLAMLALLCAQAGAQPLRLLTEEWPPFNYIHQGKATGLGVEMAEALVAEAGVASSAVEVLPWNRAYASALRDPNVLLFTLGRTEQREPLFHWITRIAPREVWFYRLAQRADIAIDSLEQAKAYRLGVGPTEDAATQELVAKGFELGKHLDSVQAADPDTLNVQKLVAGRFDLLVGNPLSVAYAARKLDIPPETMVVAYRWSLKGPGYWLALSNKSDPQLAQRLQKAAKQLESRGSFRALREQYLGSTAAGKARP